MSRCLVVLCSSELGMGNGVKVLRSKTCLGRIEASGKDQFLDPKISFSGLLCAIHGDESV